MATTESEAGPGVESRPRPIVVVRSSVFVLTNVKLAKPRPGPGHRTRKTLGMRPSKQPYRRGEHSGYCTGGSQVSRNVRPVLGRGPSAPWRRPFSLVAPRRVTDVDDASTTISHSKRCTILFSKVTDCRRGATGGNVSVCTGRGGHHSVKSHCVRIVTAMVIITAAKHSVLRKHQNGLMTKGRRRESAHNLLRTRQIVREFLGHGASRKVVTVLVYQSHNRLGGGGAEGPPTATTPKSTKIDEKFSLLFIFRFLLRLRQVPKVIIFFFELRD
jgi:hypothetical protein